MEYINIETGEITKDAFEVTCVNFNSLFNNTYYVNPNNSNNYEMLKEQCLSIGEKQNFEPYIFIELYKKYLKKDFSIVCKLIEKIKYRNILFISINELCDVFVLDDNKNLDRKLKRLAKRNIIKYNKVKRDEYKIFINPRIFYRGNSINYERICSKTEWELDGELQSSTLLVTINDSCVSDANKEKEMLWKKEDETTSKIIEDLGYRNINDYEKCVGKKRLNSILSCNLQEFVVKYIN